MKYPYFSFVCALFFLFSACRETPALPDKQAIFQQTKAANDASLQGHIEKDAAKISRVYTDDAILLPPGGAAPIVGKSAIEAHYAKGVAAPGNTLKIETENIHYEVIDEDNAQEVGRYSILFQADSTQKPIEIKGEMLIAWRRVGGVWKIKLDMWH